jgi:hypothetical protein
MNPLLKIFAFAFMLIAAVISAGFGLFLIVVSDSIILAAILLVIGVILLPISLKKLYQLNKDFQLEKLNEVLTNPDKILLRFPSKESKVDIILADEALFIGTQYLPFASFYESIAKIEIKDNKLYLESIIDAGGNKLPKFNEIEIPSELLTQAHDAVSKIKLKYLGE